MTPKEQADALRKLMFQQIFDIDNGVHTAHDKGRYLAAVKCAIIALDEIIASIPTLPNENNKLEKTTAITYWVEVKNELLKQQNT